MRCLNGSPVCGSRWHAADLFDYPERRALLAQVTRRVGKLTTMAAFLDRLGWAEEAVELRTVVARLRRVAALLRAKPDTRPPVLH